MSSNPGNAVVPATVHAALVALFIYLLQLLCAALGIVVTDNTITEVAILIVGYILSLGGLAVFNGLRNQGFVASTNEYVPPFC